MYLFILLIPFKKQSLGAHFLGSVLFGVKKNEPESGAEPH
jgi:hypothetical protein